MGFSSARLYLISIAAAAWWGVTGPETVLGQDLEVLQAAMKQRLSLLETIDADVRVWTDLEETRFSDPSREPIEGVRRFRWVWDRGRVYLEESQTARGYKSARFWDGKSQITLISGENVGGNGNRAHLGRKPFDRAVIAGSYLPALLGVLSATGPESLLRELAQRNDVRVDASWEFGEVPFDVAVVFPVMLGPQEFDCHVGLVNRDGWVPAVFDLKAEYAGGGQEAFLAVDQWSLVKSGVTGEPLAVPRRGRYVLHSTYNGKVDHFVDIVEVDRFELPAQVDFAELRPKIPDGAYVQEEAAKPGDFGRTYIAGGPDAVAELAKAADEKAKAELARLKATGKTFDARPRRTPWNWWLFGLGGLLLAVAVVWPRLFSR